MHARPTRPRLTKSIKMTFNDDDYQMLEEAAADEDLGPFCKQILMNQVSTHLFRSERLILAEVCALRRELETLLQAISDLDADDVARARSLADSARDTLVEQRLYQQQQHGRH